ncbi:MAG: hypothetical protein J6A98_00350 [Clostridia bacterium]|nr:hypothetical protein [Clostridia bacterium]
MKKKIVKIIAASGLAVMMGVGALCGTIIPMSGSAASSMTSQSSQSGLAAGHNDSGSSSSAQLGDSALTPQEQLLAGTLEFDPENDPIIAITKDGVEIKHCMLGEPPNPYYDKMPSTHGLAQYAYVEMGVYNNSPIRWVIIGYSEGESQDKYLNFSWIKDNDGTPADNAIENEKFKGKIALNLSLSQIFPNATASTELAYNEVLVLSAINLGTTTFGDVFYNGSTLQTKMRDLYYPDSNKNGAQFSEKDRNIIKCSSNINAISAVGTSTTSEYLFPLAARGEKFNCSSYISDANKLTIGATWWLRSGYSGYSSAKYHAYFVGSNGVIANGGTPDNDRMQTKSYGIRPSCVLNLKF